MYDTIKFQLKHNPALYKHLLQIIHQLGNVVEKKYQNRNAITYSSRYNFWQFTLTPTYLICTGSLPQLLYSTNLVEMSIADVERGINELNKILKTDLSSATVTQLHFASNLVVNHPVSSYFKLLANKSYTDRNVRKNNTLEFVGDGCALSFYDKTAQLKDTNQKIPSDYVGKNVLRYEMRLSKLVAKKLGFDVITVADLSDGTIFSVIKEYWYNQYQAIDKLSYNIPDFGDNPTQFKEYLMLQGIEAIGLSTLFQEVNLVFKSNYQVKNRVKKMIRKITANRGRITANIALVELENKINNVMEMLD